MMEKVDHKHFLWCMVVIICVFLFSAAVGYWIAVNYVQDARVIIARLFSEFSFVKELNVFLIFLYIFLNNALKGFLVMVFGVFFGLSAVIFIYLNGELIGLVMGASNSELGPGKVFLSLLPHGVLEIPAIILSASYGLWLGYRFYHFLRFGEPFKIYFSYALKKYVRVILPLLFVAAVIETFITPRVVRLFY